MSSLSSGQWDTEIINYHLFIDSQTSSINNQDTSEKTNWLKTKLTKKDFTSTVDLKDTEDLSFYTIDFGFIISTSPELQLSREQHPLGNKLDEVEQFER